MPRRRRSCRATSRRWRVSSRCCGASRPWPAAPRPTADSPTRRSCRRRAFARPARAAGAAGRPQAAGPGHRRPAVGRRRQRRGAAPELLRPPDPPALLLLGCHRSEDAAAQPAHRPPERREARAGLTWRELAVDALTGPRRRSWPRAARAAASGGDVLSGAVARESGGNPFFLTELVRHLQTRRACPGPPTIPAGRTIDPR